MSRPCIGASAIVFVLSIVAAPAHAQSSSPAADVGDVATFGELFTLTRILGGTPFELGAAFAACGLGRAYGNRHIANAGADLVQAQVIAEVLTSAIKQAARRARPEGSGYSFLPAYAVAACIGASRIHDRRHCLSDVAFGA